MISFLETGSTFSKRQNADQQWRWFYLDERINKINLHN